MFLPYTHPPQEQWQAIAQHPSYGVSSILLNTS